MENKIVGIKDLYPGMVVLPHRGTHYGKTDAGLDWEWAKSSAWWQHIVTDVKPDHVTFARPHAIHSEFTKQPYLTAEVYAVNTTTDQRYLVLKWS